MVTAASFPPSVPSFSRIRRIRRVVYYIPLERSGRKEEA
jgi:hypothetical protein